MRPTEGRLPDALERRLLEGTVDQDVGALAKPRGRDPRERLQILRRLPLKLGLDVDVGVQLVDGSRRDLLPDGAVVDQLRARIDELIRVQGDPVDPDGERRQQQEGSRDEQEEVDGEPPAASCGVRDRHSDRRGDLLAHAREDLAGRTSRRLVAEPERGMQRADRALDVGAGDHDGDLDRRGRDE